MKILFEDKNIIAVIKEIGVISEDGENSVPKAIREHLLNATAYVGVVHRLDTAVSGVMIYAKTREAAANLSKQIQNGLFKKEYYAVISGCPETPSGTYTDLLFKDSKKNKVFVAKSMRKGVKTAELDYEVLKTATLGEDVISLVKIKLKTGRSHQIRVQFASRKMPLLGDGKYGSRIKCDIALFSTAIEFVNPTDNQKTYISAPPEEIFPFNKFTIKK